MLGISLCNDENLIKFCKPQQRAVFMTTAEQKKKSPIGLPRNTTKKVLEGLCGGRPCCVWQAYIFEEDE